MRTIVTLCLSVIIGGGVTGCGGSDDIETECQAAAEIVMQDLFTRCSDSVCDFCMCRNDNRAYDFNADPGMCGEPIDMSHLTYLSEVDCSSVGLDCEGTVTECTLNAIPFSIGDRSLVQFVLDGSNTTQEAVWDALTNDNPSREL